MQNQASTDEIFVKYIFSLHDFQLIFTFEQKRYILLLALRDYFEGEINKDLLGEIASYLESFYVREDDVYPLRRIFYDYLERITDLGFYEQNNKEHYNQLVGAIKEYYTKNKHLLSEDK